MNEQYVTTKRALGGGCRRPPVPERPRPLTAGQTALLVELERGCTVLRSPDRGRCQVVMPYAGGDVRERTAIVAAEVVEGLSAARRINWEAAPAFGWTVGRFAPADAENQP